MGVAGKTASSSDSGKQGWGGGTEIVSEDVPIPNQHAGVIIGKGGTAHSSKERRRPLFWQPFSAVAEQAPCLLVPLSGFLASRRSKQRETAEK